MKPSYEVWLEIVKDRLLEGDSAVIAVSKAQIVVAAYEDKFTKPVFTNYGEHVSASDSGYVSGDENAR